VRAHGESPGSVAVAGALRGAGGRGRTRGRGRVPGEVGAVEAVVLPVPVDLPGAVVERERVQRLAVEGDLPGPVLTLDRAEVPGHAASGGRLLPGRDSQWFPDGYAGAARAQHVAPLLVAGVEGLARGRREHAHAPGLTDGHRLA